jgi:GT2 family glycosyltransferase
MIGDLRLSVVMPTFNNEAVLRRAVDGWRRFGGTAIEVIVVEDGCRDGTAAYLEAEAATAWGAAHLRWIHAAWQDDMLLQAPWLVPELVATFDTYEDLGMLALSRGLTFSALAAPIAAWADLIDWKRTQSTIGPAPWNWLRLHEVDGVVRPWAVRRACLEKVGLLDESYRPTEWDESDLAFRIQEAGWRVGAHGYERLGAYMHLGSTTIGTPSQAYLDRVLRNGRLFFDRWEGTIARRSARRRRTWRRRATAAGWTATARRCAGYAARRLARRAGVRN